MVSLQIFLRDGSQRSIEADAGISLMQAMRDGGVGDVLALCGGCCSCATCHVYIEGPGELGLPRKSSDEDDLLESSWHRRSTSRLACQIPVDVLSAQLRITVAPED